MQLASFYTVTNWPYLVGSLAVYVVVYAWVMFARTPKGRR